MPKCNHMDLRILLGLVCMTGCMGKWIATTMPPVRVAGHGHVHIGRDAGSIRGVTAEIDQVELHVEARGYDLQRDVDLSITSHGDRVDIIAKTHHQLVIVSRRSLRLEVRMPRDADLEIS